MANPNGRILRNKKNKYTYVAVRCPYEFSSMANSDGYVFEHRLVMARYIGRPLKRNECVHHIDGCTQNNDISNLQMMTVGTHARLHKSKKIIVRAIKERMCGICGKDISAGRCFRYNGKTLQITFLCQSCMMEIRNCFKYIKIENEDFKEYEKLKLGVKP